MSEYQNREVCYGSSVRLVNSCTNVQLTSEHQKTSLQAALSKINPHHNNHPDPQGSAGIWLIKGPHFNNNNNNNVNTISYGNNGSSSNNNNVMSNNVRMNCKYGVPVKHGDLIRMEHITTQHNLHILPEGAEATVAPDGNTNDNWRVIIEDGGIWREGNYPRVILVHDNSNLCLRICVQNKNLKVNVTNGRESASWWESEIVSPSWKVPFYTLEPLNHDLEAKPPFVVYGSGICLQHLETKRNLNTERGFEGVSHFSASDQQQVSTVSNVTTSTTWVVKGPHKQGERYNFTPKMIIRNGDIIRLEHYNTQKNLHSHTGHRSAATKQQEVTCYGQDGVGDGNDDWRVEVIGGDQVWAISSTVRLIHVNTKCALHSHNHNLDKNNNEVTCYQKRDANDMWVVVFLELFF